MSRLADAIQWLVSAVARLQRPRRARPAVRPGARGLAAVPRGRAAPDPIAHVGAFVQPDQTTCGSATLVVARMLNDPGYAARVLGSDPADLRAWFAREALSMHRRTNRCWPLFWGTTPRAVARQMSRRVDGSGVAGAAYFVRYVDAKDRGGVFDAITRAVGDGHATPVYTYDVRNGRRLSGAHVTLAIQTSGAGLLIYDPARGAIVAVTRQAFCDARLEGALGWDRPAAAVLPR